MGQQTHFVSMSLAWLWIISAAIVIPLSLWGLFKARPSREGIFVIAFYNIVFALELYASAATLASLWGDGDPPVTAMTITVVLKNLDLVSRLSLLLKWCA